MSKATTRPGQAKAKLVCLLSAFAPSITLTVAVIAAVREVGRADPATAAATTVVISIHTRHIILYLLNPGYERLASHKYSCLDADG